MHAEAASARDAAAVEDGPVAGVHGADRSRHAAPGRQAPDDARALTAHMDDSSDCNPKLDKCQEF